MKELKLNKKETKTIKDYFSSLGTKSVKVRHKRLGSKVSEYYRNIARKRWGLTKDNNVSK